MVYMKMGNGITFAIPKIASLLLTPSILLHLCCSARQQPDYPGQKSRLLKDESEAKEYIKADDSGDDHGLSTEEIVCLSCVALVIFLFALCIVCQFGKKLCVKCVVSCRKKRQQVKMHALEV